VWSDPSKLPDGARAVRPGVRELPGTWRHALARKEVLGCLCAVGLSRSQSAACPALRSPSPAETLGRAGKCLEELATRFISEDGRKPRLGRDPYRVRASPRPAELPGKAPDWAVWEMAFWLRGRNCSMFWTDLSSFGCFGSEPGSFFWSRKRHLEKTGHDSPRQHISPDEHPKTRRPWARGGKEGAPLVVSTYPQPR
jgi:hypothetical protein